MKYALKPAGQPLLLLLLTVLLILPPSTSRATNEITSYGEAINQAGRQRMLTQRMLKAWCQMGQDIRYLEAKTQLKDGMELFVAQLARLTDFAETEAIQSNLRGIQEQWTQVQEALMQKPTQEALSPLRDQLEALLSASHQVVVQLAKESGTQAGHLVNIAGRQRMLSQRMSNLYLIKAWGLDNPGFEEHYRMAVSEFEAALEELRAAPQNTPEIATLLEDVSKKWFVFREGNDLASGDFVPLLTVRMLDGILKDMNTVTGLYAQLPNAG